MTNPTAVQEYDAILATIEHYVAGGKAGKSELMKPAFHETATMSGYLGPDLIVGSIQNLYDYVDSNPPATGLDLRVASVEVTGTVAAVRLEMDNWDGHRFTDLFTMLKIEGEWKVMTKVFYLHG